MEIDRVLVLEQVAGKSIKLIARDDGKIYLALPDSSYEVAEGEVQYLGGMAFIMCYVDGWRGAKMFVTLRFSQIPDVMYYFSYWGESKLQELKEEKWNSFKSYLQYCLNFIAENVDVDVLKPTYKTEYVDNRDYGGGVFTYVHIYLSFGESWDDDYRRCYELSEELTSQLIDKKLDGEDEYNWFGEVMVQFRPTTGDREDFLPF